MAEIKRLVSQEVKDLPPELQCIRASYRNPQRRNSCAAFAVNDCLPLQRDGRVDELLLLVWRRARPVQLQNDEEEGKAADVLHLTVRATFTNDVFALTALPDEPLYSLKWRLGGSLNTTVEGLQLFTLTGGERRRLLESAHLQTLEELGVGDGSMLEVERSEVALLTRCSEPAARPAFDEMGWLHYFQRDRTIADLQSTFSRYLNIPLPQLLFRLAHVPSIRWQDSTTIGDLHLPILGHRTPAAKRLWIVRRLTPAPPTGQADAETVELRVRFLAAGRRVESFIFSRHETVEDLKEFADEAFRRRIKEEHRREFREDYELRVTCEGVEWQAGEAIGHYSPTHNALLVIETIAFQAEPDDDEDEEEEAKEAEDTEDMSEEDEEEGVECG